MGHSSSDKDKGAKALLKRLKLKGEIRVGILSGKGAEDESKTTKGKQVIDVAMYNEFGQGVPERSFIRAWFDEYKSQNEAELRKAITAITEGRIESKQAFELLGQKFVGSVQTRMSNGISPANSPVTIELKHSSVPLIDTGQLRSSVSYVVEVKAHDSHK